MNIEDRQQLKTLSQVIFLSDSPWKKRYYRKVLLQCLQHLSYLCQSLRISKRKAVEKEEEYILLVPVGGVNELVWSIVLEAIGRQLDSPNNLVSNVPLALQELSGRLALQLLEKQQLVYPHGKSELIELVYALSNGFQQLAFSFFHSCVTTQPDLLYHFPFSKHPVTLSRSFLEWRLSLAKAISEGQSSNLYGIVFNYANGNSSDWDEIIRSRWSEIGSSPVWSSEVLFRSGN